MSVIIKGIDMPKTPKTITIYPNGTIVDGDRKGLRISKAEAVEIPVLDEWCTDCKEYDHERNCCPRFNRVIRSAMDMATIFQNSKDMETIFKNSKDMETIIKMEK